MTTWRERGYVPASDGEDSEAELSTQEEEIEVSSASPQWYEEDAPEKLLQNEAARDGDDRKEHPETDDGAHTVATTPGHRPALDNGLMDVFGMATYPRSKENGTKEGLVECTRGSSQDANGSDDRFVDIDQALGLTTRPERAAAGLSTGRPAVVIPPDIAVLDLSNDVDQEDGGVALQGLSVNSAMDEARHITSSQNYAPGKPTFKIDTTSPKQSQGGDGHGIAEVSSALSSPLSSPPQSVRTLTPPSSLHPPVSEPRRLAAGFQVVIDKPNRPPASPIPLAPLIEETSLFLQRSLRQRKPIQVHPYLLEDAKYKQQMKAKGVQPVRILPREESQVGTAGNQDSQDKEYVAPQSPERDSQPRRPHFDKPHSTQREGRNGRRNEFVEAVYAVERRRRLREMLRDGSKRRKLEHTYSKKTPRLGLDSSAERASGSGQQARNNDKLDIFDFPESPSPPRPARSPLGRRDLSHPLPESLSGAPPGVRDPFLSLMDEYSNSEPVTLPKPPEPSRKSRPRGVSVSSDGSSQARGGSQGIHSSGPKSKSGSDSGSSEGNSSSGEDSTQESQPGGPSKVVNFFRKRGTRGVLPASYVRFAEKLDKPGTENHEDSHRRTRESTTPVPERRPGVARAKISSRAREPVQDLFPDDNDSDSNGDGSMITASAPAKLKWRATRPSSSAPQRQVINLLDDGDIPEDNRIDYGLPAQARRRPDAPRAKRKKPPGKTVGTASRMQDAGQSSRRQGHSNNTSSRRSNPTHSSGPRLSIVDAAAHLKRSERVPPRFLKVAARSALARRDQGRQSPSRKLLVLDTAVDTREVQDVLRNWREGTLPFGRQDILTHQAASTQTKLPSTQRLSDTRSRKPASRASSFHRTASSMYESRPQQTSLLQHEFQRRAASNRQNKSRQARPLAVVPPHPGYIAHRPVLQPQPAQFEYEIPRSQLPPRQHPTALVIEAVVRNLHHQRTRKRGPNHLQPSLPSAPSVTPTSAPRRPISRRRKITPCRIDAEVIERRQPPMQDLITDDGDPFEPINVDDLVEKDCLSGLLPFGSKYSLNFDTSPLKDGTIFNSETFIGKGCLSLVLGTPCPRICVSHQGASYIIGDMSLHWGPYEDSVATDFERVLGMIGDAAENQPDDPEEENGFTLEREIFVYQAYGFYGFVAKYVSDTLHFHDPLDAVSFYQRFLQSAERFCSKLSLSASGPSDTVGRRKTHTRLVLQANAFCLVLAFQIFRMSSASTGLQGQLGLTRILSNIGRELVRRLLRCGVGRIRSCFEDQRRRTQFEKGITGEHYLVELWVLAIQVLDSIRIIGISFWDILNDELHINRVEATTEITTFERLWQNLFTIMPLYQFDNLGVTQRIDDRRPVAENWSMVKALAGRPLNVYNSNKGCHPRNTHDYLRMVYARCYHLIAKWGWINPDSVIPVLFEFFARNDLADLSNDDDRGSPDFLFHLDKNPLIGVSDSDPCFHLLLKVIVVGLKCMKMSSTTRKISGLVYRLMPNHRRQYPKDEELQVEHLNALKNHHYLLETLYWAAPPDCRPPLDAIRLLVDPETSHRQASTVAVRAWQNLMRFQLHSNESVQSLKSLMEWFDDLAIKTLGQHHLVRSEAEKQFRLVQEEEDSNLSEQDLEENIRRNQKQLEAILNDLATSLSTELAAIPGQIPKAMILLTPAATANILNSYTRFSNKLLLQVLNLLQQFLKICKPPVPQGSQSLVAPATNVDEDSQDYGDWSGFEEVVLQDETKQAAEHFLSVTYDSLHRMLSNCFGADFQPEETLLVKIVDTWALTAGFLVQHGLKKWDVYLEYSRESWSSLRNTAQTRKFTAYFLPKIIHAGSDIYHSNKATFFSFWMRSLVERESMLKFQNEFTATLLDCDPENPLLSNPPFGKDPVTGLFKISQTEFRMRRLSLISSVLEKMRETYKAASGPKAATLKQEYAEVLRATMKAMKENFEVLQSSTVSGKYVEFVHRVVEFLLQYAGDIVEIDRFFTDSTAFPLPAMDPNYVVGQLKKYVFGLSFPGTQKQLNAFFQTLGERAALGHEQEKLVAQLSTALSEDFEHGDPGKPTMRAYFLHAVFPAYIETAFEDRAGWVLGVPVLKALGRVISDLRINMDSTNHGSVNAVMSMLATTLDSMRRAANQAMTTDDAFRKRHIVGTITLLLCAFSNAIPIVAWIYDAAEETLRATAKDCGDFLIRFAAYARKIVTRRQDDEAQRPLDVLAMSERPWSGFEQGRRHCGDSLRAYIGARWVPGEGEGAWSVAGGRVVSLPRYPGEQGDEEARVWMERAVAEVVAVAARTEVFGGVARDVDSRVWGIERRGGRARAREAAGGLFC